MAASFESPYQELMQQDSSDLSSSPDPLATSVNKENTFLRSSPLKPTSPSPRKPRATKILEDITFPSPRKIIVGQSRLSLSPVRSQTEKSLSPWKIRVTVEAEPEDGFTEPGRSQARTVKIPVLEESTQQKKPRARSRSTSRARKSRDGRRSSTGLGKQNTDTPNAFLRRLTDLDTSFLENGGVEDIKSSKKRGGRRSQKSFGLSEDISMLPPTLSDSSGEAQRDTTGSQSPAATIDRTNPNGVEGVEISASRERDSPELRELDPNHVCFRRSGRLKNGQPMIQHEANEKRPIESLSKSFSNSTHAKEPSTRDVLHSSVLTYPTPDASVQDELESGPLKPDVEEVVEFDTMLESEGFTMIDLESLPSARQFITSPPDLTEQHQHPLSQEMWPTKERLSSSSSRPSSLARPSWARPSAPHGVSQLSQQHLMLGASRQMSPEEGESDRTLDTSSSHPREMSHSKFIPTTVSSRLHQEHTSTPQAETSPKIPSPPVQPPKTAKTTLPGSSNLNPPPLSRVVKAGIALQGLLSPRSKTPSPKALPAQQDRSASGRGESSPQERLNDIFNGFDPATRRELRAGLRFGEELAKRQRLSSPSEISSSRAVEKTSSLDQVLSTSEKTRAVRHNLATPATSTTPSSNPSLHASQTDGSTSHLNSEAREHRWQQEREAVSQQIENASTSQVIMIDSDDDDSLDTTSEHENASQSSPAKSTYSTGDEDIWLAEANDSAQISSRDIEDSLFTRTQQLRQRERAKEVISKPRRTLIPSPWKRGEMDSTFLSNGDASGVFWKHPQDAERSSSTSRLPVRKDVEKTSEVSLDSVIGESEVPQEADDSENPHHRASLMNVSHNEQSLVESEDAGIEVESEHQPMQVPVRFNDSSEAQIDLETEFTREDAEQPSSPLSSPCPPPTPRSALKGSRASLSLHDGAVVDQSPRKVLFSRQSFCLDESGLESRMNVRGGTLSLDSTRDSLAISNEADSLDQSTLPTEIDEQGSEITEAAPATWLSRWTGWGAKSAALPASQPSTTTKETKPPSPVLVPSSKPPKVTTTTTTTPDPRLPPPPLTLPITGFFTDSHYKHLHILYLKSLKSSFTTPSSIRPALTELIGHNLHAADGEFAWTVSERDAMVVERWFRAFEGRGIWEEEIEGVKEGTNGGGKGERAEKGGYRRVEWTELEICMRLCQVLVGQEVRRERGDRK